MFLRCKSRRKDGKVHRSWSLVENRRVRGGRVVQRQVLYLGEINDSQRAAWRRTIEVFAEGQARARQMALFPEGGAPAPSGPSEPGLSDDELVQVRLGDLQLLRPRQWGGCWLACQLWDQLGLDDLWSPRLPASRKGTRWLNVLKTLVAYRLLDPGSEWRLHRQWFDDSAMAELLGEDLGLVQIGKLYRCPPALPGQAAGPQGGFLQDPEGALAEPVRHHLRCPALRPDQHLFREPAARPGGRGGIAEIRPQPRQAARLRPGGDRADRHPRGLSAGLRGDAGEHRRQDHPGRIPGDDFLARIEALYGKAERTWVMDRGIPTEASLARMRGCEPAIHYLVGTPKGRLSRLEQAFLDRPWEEVRQSVQVKLLEHDGEVYVLARSADRVGKERAMRRRRLKKLWRRLGALREQKLSRDQLLIKLGAAKKEAGRAYGLVEIRLPKAEQTPSPETFTYRLRKDKLRETRRREGRYLLRTNLAHDDPAQLWRLYIQLTEVEQAFKELKGDLAVRPIHHQLDHRIEAHIFVAFIAYCLQITLKQRLRALAPGRYARAVFEKLKVMQMVDVHLPTTDGRHIVLPRYTQPDRDQQILLQRLKLTLPPQPPPRITAQAAQSS